MKNTLTWIARILISILFLVSAYSKMYGMATWQFEKQLVDLGLCDWCSSPYWSRFIIGLEYAIGLGVLFNWWIKRLILPGTALLLIAFIIHLCIQGAEHGFTNGNCGCFGQLIPMTPLEAIIKNVITLGLLAFVWRNVTEAQGTKNNLAYPMLILLGSWLAMFALLPFAPCKKKVTKAEAENVISDTLAKTSVDSLTSNTSDTSTNTKLTISSTTTANGDTSKKLSNTDTAKNKKNTSTATASTKLASITPSTTAKLGVFSSVPDSKGPAQTQSRFAQFMGKFTGGNVKVDEGKKIVCMFAPGCEHCQGCAKNLCKLKSENPDFPEVAILFMDEEAEKIPEFFKVAGCTFPYQVLGIGEFWTTLGKGNTPAIFAQWHGNTIKSWEGINENEYKPGALIGVWK